MKPADEMAAVAAQVRACRRCRLHVDRTQAVPGEGPVGARLFLVGEAPGRREDASGRPFVGAAGRLLTRFLEASGVFRSEVFITNVVKCRPPDNRAPRGDEIDACNPYLRAQIALIGPRTIVTFGASAVRGLFGSGVTFQHARQRIRKYRGIPVLATYHPSAIRFNRDLANVIARDVGRATRVASGRLRMAGGGPVPPVRVEHSAGGAVFSSEGKVLLLRRAGEGLWCLPKGHVEPGESDEDAAIREIAEETGLRVRVVGRLLDVRYTFRRGSGETVRKTVRYFLARAIGGKLKIEPGFTQAVWCRRAEALRRLHFANDRRVVRAAFAGISRKRPVSSPRTTR